MVMGMSGQVIMNLSGRVNEIAIDETMEPLAKLIAINDLVGKAPRFEVYQHEICTAFNAAVKQVIKVLEQQQAEINALKGQSGPAAAPGG